MAQFLEPSSFCRQNLWARALKLEWAQRCAYFSHFRSWPIVDGQVGSCSLRSFRFVFSGLGLLLYEWIGALGIWAPVTSACCMQDRALGLGRRRESLPLGHIHLTLASATGSWEQDEKCWCLTPPGNIALLLESCGKWEPYVLGCTSLKWNFCITEWGWGVVLVQVPQTHCCYQILVHFFEEMFSFAICS